MALNEKQQKLLEQDKIFAGKIEQAKARREKKLALKKKMGLLGKLVSFQEYIESRDKRNITTIEETKGKYGRAGNRVYIFVDRYDKFFLDKKFKNSTKAKKFMALKR